MSGSSNVIASNSVADVKSWAPIGPIEECQAMLHTKPFRVSHPLANHPLFAVDTLIGVAQEAMKRRRGDLYIDAGNVTVNDKWGNIPVPEMPVADVIKRIETAGAWIIMKHVEANPQYKVILDEYAEFVRTLAGPEGARLLLNPEMLVIITSPHRITPYHFDAEVNFLVQIHGSKDLWVCDPLDRTLTTEEEIEKYYAVTINAGTFKPHAEEKATHFVLTSGDAVHIPTHGAHWVKNHDNVSVSLSLNFEFPKWLHRDVYHANYYLRRLGLSPRSPGRSLVADRTKAATIASSRFAARVVNGVYRRAKRLVGK